MHQSTTPSLSQTIWPRWASTQFLSLPIVHTLPHVPFGYSLSSETVVMRQLRWWKRLWQRSLTRSHKRTSKGSSRCCWNGTTSALQPEEIASKGTFMFVLSIKVPIRKKSGNLLNDPRTNTRKHSVDISEVMWCIWFNLSSTSSRADSMDSLNSISPFNPISHRSWHSVSAQLLLVS